MKITNKTIKKSTSYYQQEILNWISDLYCPNGFDLDCTYSKGNFYTTTGIRPPKFKGDLYPQSKGVIALTSIALPFKSESLQSIVFDPPYLATYGPSTKINKPHSNIMLKRFGHYHDMNALWEMYDKSLAEFYRVLSDKGIAVFKCQDTILSSKQYFSHVHVINSAYRIGFYPKDLFILLARNVIIGAHHHSQKHARKFHSYFLIFKKTETKIGY